MVFIYLPDGISKCCRINIGILTYTLFIYFVMIPFPRVHMYQRYFGYLGNSKNLQYMFTH